MKMVYNIQNYWVYGLFPSHGILNITRKYNISELDLFPPICEAKESYTLLGSLEGAKLKDYAKETVFLPHLPMGIGETKLRITANMETGTCYKGYWMRWTTDCTFIGSRMELTLSTFEVCKTFSLSFTS
jgi:hypothetical protein